MKQINPPPITVNKNNYNMEISNQKIVGNYMIGNFLKLISNTN